MIETIRGRLTLWYVTVLAFVLVLVSVLIYVLLGEALEDRVDMNLQVVMGIAATSLANDLAEGQGIDDAARSTAAELSSNDQMLAIFSSQGVLLGEAGREPDLPIDLPALDTIPTATSLVYTVGETDEPDDRHRLAVRRLTISPSQVTYIVLISNSLDATDEELDSLREILFSVVPLGLLVAGVGGWFLARKSLAPVVAMADHARSLGVGGVDGRLPVANPRDELGRLAGTFNELLARLGTSLEQQRHFMADASHELRTPVATARTAAGVALQRPHREEAEYRDTLEIIEQQTARLSRIVDDMFLLARADAGNFPIRKTPMYLDEVVDDVVRAERILSAARQIEIRVVSEEGAAMTGDEEMIKRMIINILDNAIRYAPAGSVVDVSLRRDGSKYEMAISDRGPGIPLHAQPHLFERFYRADPSRSRANDSGAGLGLALARWIARAHDGDAWLLRSSSEGTTFMLTVAAELPSGDA
jgi:two-component system OmpR family sensor kinase